MGPKLPPSCGRPIICSILGHFSSKASLFTCFCLGWVGEARFFTHQMPSHSGGPQTAAELRPSRKLRCLGCFSSKTSLFACFWLAWVGKPRFFTHQMPSHSGGPQTAVELRATRKLRCFGLPLLQNLAICMLLAGLGWKTSVFYAPDALS